MAGLPKRQRLRVGAVFMAFEGGMPLIGLLLGRIVTGVVGGFADIAAIVVLIGLGLYMLMSRDDDDQRVALLSRTRGFAVIGLGMSISLDELAIGFTLGLLAVPLVLAITLIAVQAFVVAQLGFALGSRVGEGAREGAERVAGIVLVLLGVGLAVARVAGIEF